MNNSSLHLLNSTTNNNIKLIDLFVKNNSTEPFYVKNIKSQIIDKFLIPITNNNLDEILTYDYMIPLLKDRLQKIILIYHSNYQLELFKQILDNINYTLTYHRIILQGQNRTLNNTDFFKMNKSLGIINIKAEYIIYDEILGNPKKGDKYNKDIIFEIRQLLNRFDINFDKIKEIIKSKY